MWLTFSYFFIILENAERFMKLVHPFAKYKHMIVQGCKRKDQVFKIELTQTQLLFITCSALEDEAYGKAQ